MNVHSANLDTAACAPYTLSAMNKLNSLLDNRIQTSQPEYWWYLCPPA